MKKIILSGALFIASIVSLSAQIVTNGTFDTDLSGWTTDPTQANGGTLTHHVKQVAPGVMELLAEEWNSVTALQNYYNYTANYRYKVSFDVVENAPVGPQSYTKFSITNAYDESVKYGYNVNDYDLSSVTNNTHLDLYFTPSTTIGAPHFEVRAADQDNVGGSLLKIDNISIVPYGSTEILALIGNDEDNTATTSQVTYLDLAAITGVNPIDNNDSAGIHPANETYYQEYIDANNNAFSSPATVAEVNTMLEVVNLLVAIGQDADGIISDINPSAAALNFLPNVSGAIGANETAYQDYINANPNAFDAPATQAQVQAMINAVNLASIGVDENNGMTAHLFVTADMLNALPTVSGAVDDSIYEAAYQYYIDSNLNQFGEPATEAQVQTMINDVAFLAAIGQDADGAANTSPTATELNALPSVTGAIAANEGAYQDYINANPDAFDTIATIPQIQAMIDTVNAQELLATIGEDADGNGPDTNATAAQLNALPNVSGAVVANQDDYQDYIDNNPNAFSSPATEAQVQTMIDTVNLLVAIGEDADGTGTDTNPTATELNNLPNVSGAIQANETAYQDYINNNPNDFSSPATEAEVQTMINTVNATLSVNDNEFIKTLSVYPNPTSDYAKISFGKTLTNVNVKVFNLVGQQVKVMVNNTQNNAVTLNVSGLAKGNYLIMITSDQGSGTKQLLVK